MKHSPPVKSKALRSLLCALLLFILSPLLTGCGPLESQAREVEKLRLAQTLGLDEAPEGLILSLASPGQGEASLCLSAPGPSVSQAMEALGQRGGDRQLFCGHLQHILLGQTYAEAGLDGLLAAVCRSPDLRIDMPVYLVLDATARKAMEQAGEGEQEVCDQLNGLAVPDGTDLSSAGRILRDLDRQGSALIRTLRLEDSPQAEEKGKVLVPWGFGVLVGKRFLEPLSPELSPAAELLCGSLRPCPLLLHDSLGRKVTVELQGGETELLPLWREDGSLEGIELRLRVQAAILEIEGLEQAADPRLLDSLRSDLESALSRRVGELLQLSRELQADFLGLGPRLELLSPLRCRGLGSELGPLLPKLRLRVSVRGELRHSGDLN